MPHRSFDEACRAEAARIGGTLEEQQLITRILMRARAEIEGIRKFDWRGTTTIRLYHPDGRIKKAFLNDREI